MVDEWKVPVEELRGRVDTLQATVTARTKEDDARWDQNRETHKDLYGKVDRPSWSVSIALSVLSSGFVGLAVFLFTH